MRVHWFILLLNYLSYLSTPPLPPIFDFWLSPCLGVNKLRNRSPAIALLYSILSPVYRNIIFSHQIRKPYAINYSGQIHTTQFPIFYYDSWPPSQHWGVKLAPTVAHSQLAHLMRNYYIFGLKIHIMQTFSNFAMNPPPLAISHE